MMRTDTPEEFRKQEMLNDIRMGEHYKVQQSHRRETDGEAGITVSVRSIWTPDWSDQHEA